MGKKLAFILAFSPIAGWAEERKTAVVVDAPTELRAPLEERAQSILSEPPVTIPGIERQYEDPELLALVRSLQVTRAFAITVADTPSGFRIEVRKAESGTIERRVATEVAPPDVSSAVERMMRELSADNPIVAVADPAPRRKAKRRHPFGLLLGGAVALLLPYFATVGLAAHYESYNHDAATRGYVPVAGPFLAADRMSSHDLDAGYHTGLMVDGAVQIIALNLLVAGTVWCSVGEKTGPRQVASYSAGDGKVTW